MYIMTQYYGQQEHFQTSKVLILENFPRLCCVSRQIFKCTYSSAETWKCYQVKGAQQNHLVHRLRPNFVLTSTYINMGCVSHFCYKNKLSCIISHNYQLSISNYIVKVERTYLEIPKQLYLILIPAQSFDVQASSIIRLPQHKIELTRANYRETNLEYGPTFICKSKANRGEKSESGRQLPLVYTVYPPYQSCARVIHFLQMCSSGSGVYKTTWKERVYYIVAEFCVVLFF